MEHVDINYTRAAIGIIHSFRHTAPNKPFGAGTRWGIHFVFCNFLDDRRIVAAEIRRMRADDQRLAA